MHVSNNLIIRVAKLVAGRAGVSHFSNFQIRIYNEHIAYSLVSEV